jgi:hypothetical protein
MGLRFAEYSAARCPGVPVSRVPGFLELRDEDRPPEGSVYSALLLRTWSPCRR